MIGPIALLFSITSPTEFPLNEPIYKNSYQLLSKFSLERNIDLRFVLGEENYKNKMFHTYWKFEGEKLRYYTDQFKAKLVYLQTRNHSLEFEKRVNNTFLENICLDKYNTAQQFIEFSKKTALVTKSSHIDNFSTDLIVLKPQFGSNGYRVQFIKKDEYIPEQFLDEKFIVQELIDSSNGIPGLISQRHELRLYLFNGKVKVAYLRLPSDGSYLSNISQGAVEKQIELLDIPSNIFELANKVDSIFTDIKPRLYALDVMYESMKPWIVELNDMPGMLDVSVQPLTTIYLQEILTLFEEAVTTRGLEEE